MQTTADRVRHLRTLMETYDSMGAFAKAHPAEYAEALDLCVITTNNKTKLDVTSDVEDNPFPNGSLKVIPLGGKDHKQALLVEEKFQRDLVRHWKKQDRDYQYSIALQKVRGSVRVTSLLVYSNTSPTTGKPPEI